MPKPFEKSPSEYTLDRIYFLAANNENKMKYPGTEKWVPARPEGVYYMRGRFSKAWKVFTGQADIVVWPGDQ